MYKRKPAGGPLGPLPPSGRGRDNILVGIQPVLLVDGSLAAVGFCLGCCVRKFYQWLAEG